MSRNFQQGETPIFDELARKYNYDRLIAGGPLDLRPTFLGRNTPFRAPGMYINAWSGVQTDETVDAAPNEEDDMIVFQKPFPVTTLADLAKGTHQE